jgi:chemotaxis protein CheX
MSDAVGEMANIVGGSVKSCLDGVAQLSLPWVARVPGEEGPRANSALQVTASWRAHPLRVTVQAGEHPFREVRS